MASTQLCQAVSEDQPGHIKQVQTLFHLIRKTLPGLKAIYLRQNNYC